MELLVRHTGSVAIDDAQVLCRNIFRREIAVSGRPIEHETLARGMPLCGFVFLLCVRFLDIIKLLVLEFVFVFSLLVGA